MSDQKQREQPEVQEGFMSQMVDLEYKIVTSPVAKHFAEQMKEGRIVGHRCSSCGRVYVPPKGYCPLCSQVTGDSDEVDVSDTAVVTSFTVVTPIQYHGQEEKEEYVLANLLLEGADSTVGQQRIEGIPHDEVRTGLRVKAVWAPPANRGEGDGRGFGLGSAIEHWEPSGEPDAPREHYEKHVL